jgi:hypothetical protein
MDSAKIRDAKSRNINTRCLSKDRRHSGFVRNADFGRTLVCCIAYFNRQARGKSSALMRRTHSQNKFCGTAD